MLQQLCWWPGAFLHEEKQAWKTSQKCLVLGERQGLAQAGKEKLVFDLPTWVRITYRQKITGKII